MMFRALVLSVMFLPSGFAVGQKLDEAVLYSLRARSQAEAETFAAGWVKAQVSEVGRERTAESLANLDAKLVARHASTIRRIGRYIDPEFTRAVLLRVTRTDSSHERGDILQLVRRAAPEHLPSIARFLSDTRTAEDLAEIKKRAPKSEALANGVKAYRVCDVAFNVMKEIERVAGKAAGENAPKIYRGETVDVRDKRIADVTKVDLSDPGAVVPPSRE